MEYTYEFLPLFQDPFYQYTLALEGETKVFSFYWNERDRHWRMDIRYEDDTPVALGTKLVPLSPILLTNRLEDFNIRGFFAVVPLNDSVDNIREDYRNLAQYYRLVYFSPV